MTYFTSSQSRPIQGVSQQPDKVRLPGQCTESINFRPDVVKGLVDRPASTTVARPETSPPEEGSKWHYYDRGSGDTSEEYYFNIEADGTIKAYGLDTDGPIHTVVVNDAGAQTYIATADPANDLVCQTIGDTTFILNKTVEVLEDSTLTDEPDPKAIVYVQFIDYMQEHRLYIDLPTRTLVAWYKSEDGDTASDIESTATRYVAERLFQALEGWSSTTPGPYPAALGTETWGTDYNAGTGGITDNFNVDLDQNTIILSRIDGNDFVLTASDDANGSNLIPVKGSISDVSKLPPYAPDGFLIQIDPPGSSNTNDANFWLKAEQTTDSKVKWVESPAPGVSIGIDETTMPVQLVRTSLIAGIATFELEFAPWGQRDVGDDRTNPHPSFVSDPPLTIQSIGLFQNRLFFTAGESVIMSRSNEFYEFYRTTTQVILDTDPVDVYADANKVNNLKASVPFDGDIVFFSDNAQFLLPGRDAVTPANATLRQTTAFESDLSVSPVASGENIFFCFDYGRFTGIREYFTDSVTDTKRARPVTDHVSQYIVGRPTLMISSSSLNLLIIKTDVDNELYVYEWLWQGSDKVQSAWGKWQFSDNSKIHDIQFRGTDFIILIERPEGLYIEVIDLGDPDDEDLDYPVRLDRRGTATFNWNPTEEQWEAVDPFPNEAIEDIVSVTKGGYQPGVEVSIERDGANLITTDELADTSVITTVFAYFGVAYQRTYIPTNPVAKDQNGEPMELDQMTVGKMHISYEKTGDIEMSVENLYGGTRSQSFGNRTVGGPENLVGYSPQVPGTHVMPIRKKADTYTLTLTTTDHRPLEIRDFQFDGTLRRRGRRL